jgi:hypothetical protein
VWHPESLSLSLTFRWRTLHSFHNTICGNGPTWLAGLASTACPHAGWHWYRTRPAKRREVRRL